MKQEDLRDPTYMTPELLNRSIKISYDRQSDAAYIYLQKKDRKVARTYACPNRKVGGFVHIDFDENDKMIGVEIIPAGNLLPKELLRKR